MSVSCLVCINKYLEYRFCIYNCLVCVYIVILVRVDKCYFLDLISLIDC